MIDIALEKDLRLSPQEVYDICDSATQAAYDDGFLNSYIFERALYVFAAIDLYPERADEIRKVAVTNINEAWKFLLNEGILEEMSIQYEKECDWLSKQGVRWFDDYTTYAYSARGLLNSIQTFTGDLLGKTTEQFQQLNEGSNIQEVMQIADAWGMNNQIPHETPEIANSIFEEE